MSNTNNILSTKQRFGIIGNSELLNRALEIALRVAPTDLSVLVTGESGVGKEFFPKIIHDNSARKHGKYVAVNCGAIPEGTIDSELFGHEKGAFTGAVDSRKGYFEEADGGTIFLDEVGELPLSTQVRLLRVLQTGEFIRVGSAKVQKTNVRVVAATNNNLQRAISEGKFREDLYYRLNTVPISVPALRERPEDIYLLFRKFASDVAVQYRMPAIVLEPAAREMIERYPWPGNIRQLKNVAEAVSALESSRISGLSDKCTIGVEVLSGYIPKEEPNMLPAKSTVYQESLESAGEREAIIRMLLQLKQEVDYLKDVVEKAGLTRPSAPALPAPEALSREWQQPAPEQLVSIQPEMVDLGEDPEEQDFLEEEPEDMSIKTLSLELIEKVLRKHAGYRKAAAQELGISERTLYRKIKQLNK